jgi:catechol 2,3-dioxygenase-like lactoylglutathione lyase family enzyme
MDGYVTIGALDSEKSVAFYDQVLGAIGYVRAFFDKGWAGYGPKGCDAQDVFICPPANGKPARAGNGVMIAFRAPTKAAVDAAYKAALSAGGTDEGKPGPRPEDSTRFYGAYMRDPTGNKICVFCRPDGGLARTAERTAAPRHDNEEEPSAASDTHELPATPGRPIVSATLNRQEPKASGNEAINVGAPYFTVLQVKACLNVVIDNRREPRFGQKGPARIAEQHHRALER